MKGTPLVLLHGYPFDHTLWFSTIASLGRRARVLAPDLPGFGRTPLPYKKTPSIELMADFVAEFLDQSDKKEVILAGMSMGGYVALAFANKYPQRLKGLGLISTKPGADTAEAKKGRKEIVQKIKSEGPQIAAQLIMPRLFAKEKPGSPEYAAYAQQGAERAGTEGLTFALEAMAARPDRTSMLRKLKIPVLFAHGNEDRLLPFAPVRDLAESCHDPILVEIKGAGHATPLEAPDQLAAALARLVDAVREAEEAPAAA